MDDHSSESLWGLIRGIFRSKSDLPLEEAIHDAQLEGDLSAEDMGMLMSVLRLGRELVYEIMVPRTDIVCAEVGESVESICELIIEHGHSRIPVYERDKDNIVGIVHAKDLLKSVVAGSGAAVNLREVMRQPLFVPENKNVRDMLREFLAKRQHLAIALDEYGGTSGLVTLEDVIEEIVGEIADEHDPEEPEEIQRLENGDFLVSGRVYLEDLNEATGMRLDSEQVETLGGYLCELSGRVPKPGETFVIDGRKVTVKEADKKQVRAVLIQEAEDSQQLQHIQDVDKSESAGPA